MVVLMVVPIIVAVVLMSLVAVIIADSDGAYQN